MIKKLVCGVALLAACSTNDGVDLEGGASLDAPAVSTPAHHPLPTARPGVPTEEPIATIFLENGNELRFFGAPGKGTAVLELGNVNNGAALTTRPELRDATPAEIFWAVSPAATKVPSMLARPANLVGRAQGWLVAELAPSLDVPAQCTSDVVFDDTYCSEPAPYDSHKCFFNRTGNTTWISNRSSRYKVGLCVQSGTVHDQLSFDYFNPSGACDVPFEGPIAWQFDVGAGGSINWTWIAGSGDLWRKFTHSTTNATGDVFDHGQMWNNEPSCL